MEDNELISGCLRGNVEDFREIMERYSAPAMALALNVLGNRDDAEDACQEAFIQVYHNLHRFDTGRSFKNWLFIILYRRCLDQLKRRRRFIKLLKKLKMGHEEKRALEADNPPEGKGLPSLLLEHLSSKERAALCLWANEGYTAREISDILRCSASTARVYLFQARKKIKNLLERENGSLQNN
jgi:RNA polymerase sigma-70 factor (ECF subfamily)